MSTKVAVVTGSNKGIGLAIVEGLLKKFDGIVYLTSRDVDRGQKAVEELKAKGLTPPRFHQLDISDKDSIDSFRDHLQKNHGGIDVLVNNAGFAYKQSATEPIHVQAKGTIAINYFGTQQCCEKLFPLLRDGARVVNVSSAAGFLPWIGDGEASKALRAKFATSDTTLQTSELDELMNDFVKTTEAGNHSAKGWPGSTYVVSKVGLSALTRIQNREMQKSALKDVAINHVHPGYVDTDMTSHKGHLSPEQGAASSVYLALLPPGTDKTGKYFWQDCTEVDWVNGPTPSKF